MKYTTESILAAAEAGARQYAAEQFEVLRTFSTIDCGSRNEEGNRKVVEIIDGLLGQIRGIEIEHRYFEGYGINIVARLKPEHPTGKIILNAHTDTVFKPGDCEKYPMRIEGDTAYGLGIIDCKGGILVAIYAVRIMQEHGLLPDKEIVFIFNCDEEIGSPTGHQVFYPQLGVKLCSMAGGGVQKIYMVFLREPSRRDRSGSDLFHLRDGFEIKMNFDRNVSCFIFVNALMHDDFFD